MRQDQEGLLAHHLDDLFGHVFGGQRAVLACGAAVPRYMPVITACGPPWRRVGLGSGG
jgi:hypothetical protein